MMIEFFDRITALETRQKYSTMLDKDALRRCVLPVIFVFFCLNGVSYASATNELNAEFAKGVALAQEGKQAEAIAVFSAMIQAHPELPEPYNNLAVIYAQQGQYEKAQLALEMAIKTHPSYTIAHQNLGSIYSRMASDAYDKALQVDRSNNNPLPQLEMIKEIVPVGSVKIAAIRPTSRLPAFLEPKSVVIPVPTKQPPAPVASEPVKSVPAQVEAMKVEPPKAVAEKPDPQQAVLTMVQGWAHAWTNKNVAEYLTFYAQDFNTPNGESRADWAKGRELRIKKPVAIRVQVLSPKITIEGDRASVSFRQDYRAGAASMRTSKVLLLKQVEGKWLIEKEVAGK
jgi:hypothetical protein